jgi:hypothetical protein
MTLGSEWDLYLATSGEMGCIGEGSCDWIANIMRLLNTPVIRVCYLDDVRPSTSRFSGWDYGIGSVKRCTCQEGLTEGGLVLL